jgi:SAM-dependent methyltransferase
VRPSYRSEAGGIIAAALGVLLAGAALIAFAVVEVVSGSSSVPAWSWALGVGLLAVGTVLAGILYRAATAKRFLERDAMGRAVALAGAARLLDIGCGRGMVLFDLLKRSPGATGVGVEAPRALSSDSDGTNWFASNARAEGVEERAGLVAADARELPFRDATFEVVVSRGMSAGLRTPDSLREAIVEMTRVLAPGGRLVVVVFDPAWLPTFGEVLDGAGFVSTIEETGGLFSVPLVLSRKPSEESAPWATTAAPDGGGPGR